MSLKSKIKSNPRLKNIAEWLLTPPGDPRPRWWIRTFVNPIKQRRGGKTIIRNFARMDILPYNNFSIGGHSIIEDFAVINNGVGDVSIGNGTIIGIGSVVIGPVAIGNNVMLAQHIVASGLNHGYEDINTPPSKQPVTCKQIIIEDNVWIGANAVVTAGVTIGKHAVVGAGAVVTKDVPSYSIVVGNPAKVVKKYDQSSASWKPVTL